jgi:hypothetical protein
LSIRRIPRSKEHAHLPPKPRHVSFIHTYSTCQRGRIGWMAAVSAAGWDSQAAWWERKPPLGLGVANCACVEGEFAKANSDWV